MLTKEEELRVTAFISAAKADLEKDATYTPEFYISSVLWLAEKLKEANDELKENENVRKQLEYMTNRYEETDRTLGNVYSNEISDRFYPR